MFDKKNPDLRFPVRKNNFKKCDRDEIHDRTRAQIVRLIKIIICGFVMHIWMQVMVKTRAVVRLTL